MVHVFSVIDRGRHVLPFSDSGQAKKSAPHDLELAASASIRVQVLITTHEAQA
jgi:hypothetical protein